MVNWEGKELNRNKNCNFFLVKELFPVLSHRAPYQCLLEQRTFERLKALIVYLKWFGEVRSLWINIPEGEHVVLPIAHIVFSSSSILLLNSGDLVFILRNGFYPLLLDWWFLSRLVLRVIMVACRLANQFILITMISIPWCSFSFIVSLNPKYNFAFQIFLMGYSMNYVTLQQRRNCLLQGFVW